MRSSSPRRSALRCRWKDRKSTRLNSSHLGISYAVFCLKKKKKQKTEKHKKTEEEAVVNKRKDRYLAMRNASRGTQTQHRQHNREHDQHVSITAHTTRSH